MNVIGGLRVSEPAADLAIAAAIASSFRNKPVFADLALIGEVGLSGELRAVGRIDSRLNETAKLGFKRCIIPRSAKKRLLDEHPGMQIIDCRSLAEAIDVALVKQS